MFRLTAALFALSALSTLSACTTDPDELPSETDEAPLPSVQVDGELTGGEAPERTMTGPVVVAIDFGSARPRTELRVDYAGPPPYLVALLRDAMGLEPELERDMKGQLKLMGLDGARVEEGLCWLVLQERNLRYTRLTDLSAVAVQPGDRLHFQLDRDDDGDGVGARLELQYGTRDDRADTDGDGLSDWVEIFDGWTLPDGRFVQSDPTLADSDGDGINDADERRNGSDPRGE